MEAFRTQLCVFLLLLRASRGETKPNDPDKLKDSRHGLQWPINPLTGEVIFDRCLSENKDPFLAAQLSGYPYIPFPLPRPNPNNIFAICQYGNHRPRYTKAMLPRNGYDDIRRQARAINQLESWLSMCCRSEFTGEDLTLCCAKQAWEKSLSAYCDNEARIKTLQPFCCCQPEPEKWACFEREASRLSYQPSSEGSSTILPSTDEGFNFDPATCQKTSIVKVRPRQTTNINSPWNAHMPRQTFVHSVLPAIVGEKESVPFLQQPVESVPFLQQPEAINKRLIVRVSSVLENTGSPHSLLVHQLFPSRASISFPLAQPNSGNVIAICQYGNRRPRYPKEILPQTGFGYLYRQASTVNQLESWFSFCCAQDEELILCCTQQAWEMSLSAFCEEEFSIKTNHYHCCLRYGSERLECFKDTAPNKLYLPSDDEQWDKIPSTVQSFEFNSAICLKTRIPELKPRTINEEALGLSNISFPPGRPNSLNIESICANQKQRPRYVFDCLPSMGYEWLSRKYKAINNLEKGFGQCCKENNNVLTCAEEAWKNMVSSFCVGHQRSGLMQFDCCNQDRENQYACFASAAPNPDYILSDNTTQSETQPTLSMLCDTNISLLKLSLLPVNVDKIAEQCCALVEEQRPACIQTQLGDVCNLNIGFESGMKKCCMEKFGTHSLYECLNQQLLLNIAKVNRVISNNHRNCPISF